VLEHQARLDFFFQGQAGQFVGVDGADEVREGLADQQRLLLPVVAQEFPGRDAAQQLQWVSGFMFNLLKKRTFCTGIKTPGQAGRYATVSSDAFGLGHGVADVGSAG
jgi:hypothetical protein